MTIFEKVRSLEKKENQSLYSSRIISELGYALTLSGEKGGIYDRLIEEAADLVIDSSNENGGVITKSACLDAENILMPLQEDAKSYRVHCVSHAHIDMNWMWGYQETSMVAIDTFRTILDLMKEYPDFTFAQSQASTYKIVEDYAPEMIDEIKKRVHEGRWELSASTWVETDKNMPSGESLARHILYTKQYLTDLFDIDPDSLELDFEPDTFGHNISVPEICNKGGVKYYYHMRGNKDSDSAYVWKARSGAELLVWFDPYGYNGSIESDSFREVPFYCEKYGIDCFLYVYGVGDHGGGPTRRDLDKLIEMQSWPIMPTIFFSTYGRFFKELEKYKSLLPVREGEINYIFTGCFTSQSRIKASNRTAESRLFDAEFMGSAAKVMTGAPDYGKSFSDAWKKTLFNHFHDILTGSGVRDTREYALGQFQQTMACVNSNTARAMRNFASAIDTSSIATDIGKESRSEGAGVGYTLDENSHYSFPKSERGTGKTRIIHLFNPTQYDFDGVTEFTVWDWNYDPSRLCVKSPRGSVAEHKILNSSNWYWGHKFMDIAIKANIPAFGYSTYIITETELDHVIINNAYTDRIDSYNDDDIVLENKNIRASFDHSTMQLISLIDKKTGEDLIALPAASFRLISENTVHEMTSWRVGEYMDVKNLNESENVRVYEINLSGIRKWVKYDIKFGERSVLRVTVRLDDDSSMLDFDVSCDFHEIGNERVTPQLNFALPVAYPVSSYRYDVPFGTIDREPISHDVPANSFAIALNSEEESPALMLISDSKYGFRGCDNSLSLSLIRASRDPDPYPELGNHAMRIGVGIIEGNDNVCAYKEAAKFLHPVLFCSARSGNGSLPLKGSFLKINGDVSVSSIKTSEDSESIILRLYDSTGKGDSFTLDFSEDIKEAYLCDLNETFTEEIEIDGNALSLSIAPYEFITLSVKF